MQCENNFCIYWLSNGSCSLSEISLDIRGMCQCCIYLDVPEDILEQERKNLLSLYQAEEKKSC